MLRKISFWSGDTKIVAHNTLVIECTLLSQKISPYRFASRPCVVTWNGNDGITWSAGNEQDD